MSLQNGPGPMHPTTTATAAAVAAPQVLRQIKRIPLVRPTVLSRKNLPYKQVLTYIVLAIQSRPLVRLSSTFCPKKIDHISGLTLHPGTILGCF